MAERAFWSSSLVTEEALRFETSACKPFRASVLWFRASAIGLVGGACTGAGVELFNSSSFVNKFVGKDSNSSFVTNLLCGTSEPTHGSDYAMEPMSPSMVVFRMAVRGLPSDRRVPLKGSSTEVLVVLCTGEGPKCSLASEPRRLCRCSRTAVSLVNLTFSSDGSLGKWTLSVYILYRGAKNILCTARWDGVRCVHTFVNCGSL